jgi:DnaK suppressor protein
VSVPTDPSGQAPVPEHTVAVDLTAFLPEGVALAGVDDDLEESATAPTAPTASWRPDLESLDAVEADLDAVDEALRALDDATYGSCRVCAQPIADDQLAAAPTRTTCAAHA